MNKNDLFGTDKDNYLKYEEHLFEQYKLFVESSIKVSERREKANIFFITANTTLISIVGFFFPYLKESLDIWPFLLSIIGIIICYFWWRLIHNYKQLNSGKFKVIHDIEMLLPLKLFFYEWEILERGRNKKVYQPLTYIEKNIPIVFGIVYLIIAFVLIKSFFF